MKPKLIKVALGDKVDVSRNFKDYGRFIVVNIIGKNDNIEQIHLRGTAEPGELLNEITINFQPSESKSINQK